MDEWIDEIYDWGMLKGDTSSRVSMANSEIRAAASLCKYDAQVRESLKFKPVPDYLVVAPEGVIDFAFEAWKRKR